MTSGPRTARPCFASVLSAIRRLATTVAVHISTGKYNPLPDIDTVYHVSTSNPSVEWHPFGSYAVIKVKFSGSATTRSVLPNASFDVEQDIVVNFDGGAERLFLTVGYRKVSASVGGPFGGAASGYLNQAIHNAVDGIAKSAAAQAQPSLDSLINRKIELINQLRTFDDQADAYFASADFTGEGLVLGGEVTLSHRQPPVAHFERIVGEDAYTAFQSWIPGGRVDEFRWNWTWHEGGTPGALTSKDVFLLRRPEIVRSRWGGVLSSSLGETTPLPGLDGQGRICLEVRGVQTDSTAGALVPVTARLLCHNFGLGLSLYAQSSLFLRVWRDEPELSQDVPFPELALIDARTLGSRASANTLVLSVGEAWDRRAGEVLGEALERSRRQDAGLGVLVLFRDGTLSRGAMAEVEEWGRRWGTPVLANEDVNGAWSAALRLPRGREAWRLINPVGGVTWLSDERPVADHLAKAFDETLHPSAPPSLEPVRLRVRLGLGVSADALHPSYLDLFERASCPPIPLGRLSASQTLVGFAVAGSASSAGKLQQMNALLNEAGDDPPFLVAIATGSSAAQAQQMQKELGLRFPVLPDESGAIAQNFGVSLWPTAVTLDRSGIVTAIDEGFYRERAGSCCTTGRKE